MVNKQDQNHSDQHLIQPRENKGTERDTEGVGWDINLVPSWGKLK